ncbi:hypothetical protein IU487_34740 [Nocardia puris]|uniref:hypothetical protein n=1 Tax=Nocardia puris TaxID=208602 RepID=UPI001892EC4F|nr:hypothetical protein [Nocardia puris]MBF6216154.1 hypothetical protein [Nocardia puris]
MTSSPGVATIAGYAVLATHLLDAAIRAELAQLGESDHYAALFIYDTDSATAQPARWTLFGTDADYARLLCTHSDRLEVSVTVLREKFPAFQPGWTITTDPLSSSQDH